MKYNLLLSTTENNTNLPTRLTASCQSIGPAGVLSEVEITAARPQLPAVRTIYSRYSKNNSCLDRDNSSKTTAASHQGNLDTNNRGSNGDNSCLTTAASYQDNPDTNNSGSLEMTAARAQLPAIRAILIQITAVKMEVPAA